jgi:non-specific serine/threonine protein kinase
MIGRTISHYRITKKLGEGGMGEVYLAEDTKLNRRVALKFLPIRLASDEELRVRFKREAQAAATLNHPNIITVYEVSEHENRPYMAMEYVEGESLKGLIATKELSIGEVLAVALQISDGLAAAHQAGIVHRDIKPQNILMGKDGRVRICDFGLAKAKRDVTLTQAGSTLGTIAYMSPEQARGKETDHRSDLFSFGVMLYEMVTGRLPFKGEHEAAVINSVVNDTPEPLARYKSGMPEELQKIVSKAMEKNLQTRYQHVDELGADLRKLGTELDMGVTKAPESATKPTPSIAVLPFRDMSAQKDQEYFCEGMAEELINAFVKVEGLRVVARTSSFSFRGKEIDIRDIGKKLNVGTILEGSVRKAGNRLRITAQLVKVADGCHVWSEKYDRDLEDIFSIQDEIAQSIVQALKVELSAKEKRALKKTATDDVEAYDFYLRGRKFFYQARRKSIEFAREMFSRAIRKDPGYSLAHAGIADCCSWLFLYGERNKVNVEQAFAASQRALELDSELAEAHSARGLAVMLRKKYDESEREFEIAIRLNPKLFEAYYFFARTCFVQGKLEKAARLFEQACLVSPDDYQAPFILANTYKGLNLAAKVEVAYRRGLEIVERQMELNPDDSRAINLGAIGLIELGEREKAFDWCHRALSIDPEDPVIFYNIACVYLLAGKVEEAINYFERTIETGYAHKEWIENDSYLDSIRSHPRFQALLKKLDEQT